MRVVIQRTSSSQVIIENKTVAAAGPGLTLLVGIKQDDTETDVDYMVEKIINLRIFSDRTGKMNLSLRDVQGDLLIVSQFTLYADCHRGRRPNFTAAARPETARRLYELFIDRCRAAGVKVACGIFQADMVIKIDNDGPVTIILDSKPEKQEVKI